MTELFSQYSSGIQFTAGPIAGSAAGASGINPIVDRLNSIADNDGIYSNLGSGNGIDINAGSVVALRNKTSYYALPGTAFHARQPDVDDIIYDDVLGGQVTLSSSISDGILIAPVNLPHGAIVTSARVQGGDNNNVWALLRTDTVMASANLNSSDSSITAATIDNRINFEYAYHFRVSGMGGGDDITFATISYTTDYD